MAKEKLIKPNSNDQEVLDKFQQLIGKELEQVDEIEYGTCGYTANKDGYVDGIGLYNSISQIKLEEAVKLLEQLANLTTLYLGGNGLTDITSLQSLVGLTTLDLYNNNLTDITSLQSLVGLTTLYLYNNNLTDITSLQSLVGLTELDLGGNGLTDIGREFFERDWAIYWGGGRGGLNLADNPLETPPVEIVKQGKEAVLNYFEEMAKGAKIVSEVKVILLGDGSAGKTSLVKRLVFDAYDKHEPQTHGIYLEDWQIKIGGEEVKVHFWDFGGQDIMKATHQFFYTHRSLYVLVLHGRPGENHERWLKQIDNYGGDSPIIVVINKIDENPGFNVNGKFLQEKYNNIVGFYRVSCDTREGIDEFSKALCLQLGKIEMINVGWPSSWVEVKEELEDSEENHLELKVFREICLKHGVDDKGSQNTLLENLHQLGVMLHFEDYELKQKQVLNPVWVTGGAYKIITSKQLADNKGELKKRELNEILNQEKFEEDDYRSTLPKIRYTHDEERYLMDLMKKFELCYEIPKKSAILVPDLLPVVEKDIPFDYENEAIRFYFQYDFLPDSTLPRFIVKMNNEIIDDLQWRTGVALESKVFKSKAVVIEDTEACKIDIYVVGEQKSDHFAAIRKTFYDINGDVKVDEWVPLPDSKEAVEYKELLGHWLDGKEECYIGKLRKTFSVQELLNGIEKPEEREKRHVIAGGDTYINYGDRPSYGKGTSFAQNISGENAKVSQVESMRDHIEGSSFEGVDLPPEASTDSDMPKECAESQYNIPDLAKIIETQVENFKEGKILYNPPEVMKVGIKERVEVRITEKECEDFVKGLVGKGLPHIENIKISTFMKVELTGDDNFKITSFSSPEQLIAKDTHTQWNWDVLPLHKGKHALHLRVTIRIKVDGSEEKRDYPVIDKDIEVKVNVPYSVKSFIKKHYKWIIGSLIVLLGFSVKDLFKKEDATAPQPIPVEIKINNTNLNIDEKPGPVSDINTIDNVEEEKISIGDVTGDVIISQDQSGGITAHTVNVNQQRAISSQAQTKKEKRGDKFILQVILNQTAGVWDPGTMFKLQVKLSGPYETANIVKGLPSPRFDVRTAEDKENGIFAYSTRTAPLKDEPLILEIQSVSDIDLVEIIAEPLAENK